MAVKANTKAKQKSKTKVAVPRKRVYTLRELYLLARAVGLSHRRAQVAAAVGMAESGGRADVYNGICCYGLWQIHIGNGYGTAAQLKKPMFNAKVMARMSNKGRDWGQWEAYTNGAYRQYMNRASKLKNAVGGPVPAAGSGKQQTVTPQQQQMAAAFAGGLPGTQLTGVNPPIPGVPPIDIPGLGNPIPTPDDILSFPAQVEDTFRLINHMFEAQFWFKVGKVILGVAAVGVGLNAILKMSTGMSPGGAVKKSVGTAASLAATKGTGAAKKVVSK